MTIRFDNQVAIVTGAGAGLGRDYAIGLAKRGAKVVVNDPATSRPGEGPVRHLADDVVREIAEAGGQAIANHDSIAAPEGATHLAATAIDAWGRIDILVNNAGILRDSSFAKASLTDVEDVIRVHLMGTLYITHACWPQMVTQQYGRVIVATSMVGYMGNFGQTAYGCAKMGVLGMMRTLAVEGARKGIAINAISPAAVTQMSSGLNPPALEKYMTSDKVVPALLYLASRENSDTALVIEAMAGGFGRVAMFENDFVTFDPSQDVTAEMVSDKWAEIVAMNNAREIAHGPADRPIGLIKSYDLWFEAE